MDIFEQVLASARPYLRDCAHHAAFELGVFVALADGGATAAGLAARLDVAQHRLTALLDVLALEGSLARRISGERVEYWLRQPPERPAPPPPHGWGRLADVLRDDDPLSDHADERTEAAYHDHLVEAGADPARRLARELLAPAGPRLLDAGSGAGAYSTAFLEARPDGRATLVDHERVLGLAARWLAPFADRAALVAGELPEVVLPSEHDVALLANVLHLHGAPRCRRICARVAAALRPGGLLVVKDVPVAPDRSGPARGLYFALNMALYTQAGSAYDPGEIAAWLEAAGLDGVGPDAWLDATVVVGRAPASA